MNNMLIFDNIEYRLWFKYNIKIDNHFSDII